MTPVGPPPLPLTGCCLQGLALAPDDAWAVHSVAHVYEMRAEADKGLTFYQRTEKDWQVTAAGLPAPAARTGR